MTQRSTIATLLLILATAAAGCRRDGAPPEASPAATAVRADEAAASHILVAYAGARDCPTGVTRSATEAEERARQIAVMLRSGRGEFATLARKYSDDPTVARNGGYLGIFRRGDLDPSFEAAVFESKPGAVTEPIGTPYGWHVVRREPVRRAYVHHILVAWRDAARATAEIERDHAEAQRIAQALRQKALRNGANLCDLALKYSDDPHSRIECGDIGWVEPGVLEPQVDEVLFALAPHEISPVIETEFGFHIFWRE